MVDVQQESGSPGVWLLPIKAVPGARRDAIVGPYGERLKVRVAAPPEGGKANRAICALIAGELGIRKSAVTVANGPTSPEKTIRIDGTGEDEIRAIIGD